MRRDDLPAKLFTDLKTEGGFDVKPADANVNLFDSGRYEQLALSSLQKMRVSAMVQQMPSVMASDTLAHAYVAVFPDGIQHALDKLNQGGVSSYYHVDGKFAGTASLYSVSTQAAVLGAFNVMSAVTGQYFLAEINSRLTLVNSKLDQIIGFLNGEKKAELLAEINFVKYVYANYASIMQHEDQRSATIGSLQGAKKIAMKDIEFYLGQIEVLAKKEVRDFNELRTMYGEVQSIRENLELSRELYVVASLLELYCAQNYDADYRDYVEMDVISYINRCDAIITKSFGSLENKVISYKAKPFESVEGKEKMAEGIVTMMEPYNSGKDSTLRTSFHESLQALSRKETCYMDQSGNVYVEKRRRTANNP